MSGSGPSDSQSIRFTEDNGPWEWLVKHGAKITVSLSTSDRNVSIIRSTNELTISGVSDSRLTWEACCRIAGDSFCNGLFKQLSPTEMMVKGFRNNTVAKHSMDLLGISWAKTEWRGVLTQYVISPKAFVQMVLFAATALSKSDPKTDEEKLTNVNAMTLVEAARAFVNVSSSSVRTLMMKSGTNEQMMMTLLQKAPDTIKAIYKDMAIEKSTQRDERLEILSQFNDIRETITANREKKATIKIIVSLASTSSEKEITDRLSLTESMLSYVKDTPQFEEYVTARETFTRSLEAGYQRSAPKVQLLQPPTDEYKKDWAMTYTMIFSVDQLNRDEDSFHSISHLIAGVVNDGVDVADAVAEMPDEHDYIIKVLNRMLASLGSASTVYIESSKFSTIDSKTREETTFNAIPFTTMLASAVVHPALASFHSLRQTTIPAINVINHFDEDMFDPEGSGQFTPNIRVVGDFYNSVMSYATDNKTKFLHHLDHYPLPSESNNNSAIWLNMLYDTRGLITEFNGGMFAKVAVSVEHDLLYLIMKACGLVAHTTTRYQFLSKMYLETESISFIATPDDDASHAATGGNTGKGKKRAGDGGDAARPSKSGKSTLTPAERVANKVRPDITRILAASNITRVAEHSQAALVEIYKDITDDDISLPFVTDARDVVESLRHKVPVPDSRYFELMTEMRQVGVDIYVDAILGCAIEKALDAANYAPTDRGGCTLEGLAEFVAERAARDALAGSAGAAGAAGSASAAGAAAPLDHAGAAAPLDPAGAAGAAAGL